MRQGFETENWGTIKLVMRWEFWRQPLASHWLTVTGSSAHVYRRHRQPTQVVATSVAQRSSLMNPEPHKKSGFKSGACNWLYRLRCTSSRREAPRKFFPGGRLPARSDTRSTTMPRRRLPHLPVPPRSDGRRERGNATGAQRRPRARRGQLEAIAEHRAYAETATSAASNNR